MLELDSTTAAQPLTIFDFLAPESFEEGKHAFFAMREGRRGVLRTYHLISARKNLRQVEVVGNRITYDGYPATILSARDITGRLAMEAALKTSERKFELLANTSIDIINYHDSDLVLTYISPAVRSILGYEPEEIIGKCVLDLAYSGDKELLLEIHRSLLEGERDGATLEFRMLHRDGQVVWLESTVHAISDPAGGGVKDFYNITRDITPRKTAEEIAHRRDRVLHGFATASGFLLTGRLKEPIPRVLETIGEAMGADVAYIYKDGIGATGGSHTAIRRYRWAREETTRTGPHRTGTCGEGHHFPIEWSHRLNSGVWISGCMSRFTGADREVLEDLGIHAILLVPVFVHETYWGFIGVSDLSVDRVWADTEIEILMTLAATIGLVIEQRPAVLEDLPANVP
jgi:PAS domain S-box-containing protein